jgi:hypothetical protein
VAIDIEDEVRWGELREYPVAQVVSQDIWPGSSVYRLKPYADFDFAVVADNVLVGYIEVKARKHPHNQYPSTAVHANKHIAGRFARKFFKVPSYCAVLFTDRLGVFDLSTSPDENAEMRRADRDTVVPHSYYNISRLRWLDDGFLAAAALIERIKVGAQSVSAA